jgi:hypothetical protein
MKRALIAVRLSRMTDATTSPERQREKCLELCRQRGYEVVGVAEPDMSTRKLYQVLTAMVPVVLFGIITGCGVVAIV